MEPNQAEQTSPMPANRKKKEHQWLQKLVGEWTYEIEAMMEPDQPPVKSTGTETVRWLGHSESCSLKMSYLLNTYAYSEFKDTRNSS